MQDDWRPITNLSVSLGVRYDLDTNANDPDFSSPSSASTGARWIRRTSSLASASRTTSPGTGSTSRAAAPGIFTGRYLLVPLFTELQQNGITGRITYTNANGALLGFPQFTLDPNNPQNTGIRSKPAIGLLAPELKAPQSTQATLGFTTRLGKTGLYADVEGVYMKGRDEIAVRDVNWSGNATHTRPITAYDQVNEYTNDGRSEYKAARLQPERNISRAATSSRPRSRSRASTTSTTTSAPSSRRATRATRRTWRPSTGGRGRTSACASSCRAWPGCPWQISVAPVFEYGTGQPWTQRLGYDFNGDGKTGDRLPGVDRFGQDGPRYSSLNLRVAKAVPLSGISVDVIAEVFNLFNTVNYDVTTHRQRRVHLRARQLANPTAAFKPNPNYGNASATLPSREVQLGVRVSF